MEQSQRHKDLAIRTDHLDAYLKDVFKSGLFFFLAAPFIFYRVYWLKEDIFNVYGNNSNDYEQTNIEDQVVTLLK